MSVTREDKIFIEFYRMGKMSNRKVERLPSRDDTWPPHVGVYAAKRAGARIPNPVTASKGIAINR